MSSTITYVGSCSVSDVVMNENADSISGNEVMNPPTRQGRPFTRARSAAMNNMIQQQERSNVSVNFGDDVDESVISSSTITSIDDESSEPTLRRSGRVRNYLAREVPLAVLPPLPPSPTLTPPPSPASPVENSEYDYDFARFPRVAMMRASNDPSVLREMREAEKEKKRLAKKEATKERRRLKRVEAKANGDNKTTKRAKKSA